MEIKRPTVAPISERILEEFEDARREALRDGELIEPSEEEKKNGWTTQSLTAYLKERYAAQSVAVDVNSLSRQVARRKDVQNHKYNPRRWRS